jgi:hypothetical protein
MGGNGGLFVWRHNVHQTAAAAAQCEAFMMSQQAVLQTRIRMGRPHVVAVVVAVVVVMVMVQQWFNRKQALAAVVAPGSVLRCGVPLLSGGRCL